MSVADSHIADIRKEYLQASLDETAAGSDPVLLFRKWFGEAEAAEAAEVNAMTLATIGPSGAPRARIVLLKGLDDKGFTFFTNYDSDKGHELAVDPRAALVFFWKELERQVRIEGIIEKVSPEESDQYFHSRPAGSRLGAWASPQSRPVASREVLENAINQFAAQFPGDDIPRPQNWGGYRLIPNYIEFWQGRASRLHDRIAFTADIDAGTWTARRLAP